MACAANLPQLGCCSDCSWEQQSVPRYDNITTVPSYNPPGGAAIAPYARPVAGEGACGGTNEPPCAPWNPVPSNVYQQNGTVDLGVARFIGWKGVQAVKSWHGVWPFTSTECDTPATAETTKYRTVTIVATEISAFLDDACAWTDDLTAQLTVVLTVGKNTGVIEQTTWEFVYPAADDPPDGYTAEEWAIIWEASRASMLALLQARVQEHWDIATSCPTDSSGSEGSGGVDRCGHPFTAPRVSWSTEVERDTYLWSELTKVSEEGTERYNRSVSFILSNSYTAVDVRGDIATLMGNWDMGDDALYPWRTDGFLTICPLVTYAENPTAREISLVESMLEEGWTDSVSYGGGVVGAPNPAGYGAPGTSPAVHRGHFNFSHENMRYDVGPPAAWTTISYGAWTPNELPANATQWTNQRDAAKVFYPGALLQVNTSGVFHGCKLAVAQFARPAHNYFRPCGSDRYLVDEDTVRCVSVLAGVATVEAGGDPGWQTGHHCLVVFGSASGIYQVTRTSGTTYTLGTKLADVPTWFTGEEGMMGRLRFWSAASSPHGAAAWPICGRRTVAAAVQHGGNVDITLGTGADYLLVGDVVEFSGVSGLTTATVASITDATHFAVAGTLTGPYSSGGYVKSSGAPDHAWNDATSRGDYIALTAQYTPRSSPTPSKTCTTGNQTQGECGLAIVFSPNSESFANQVNHGFGSVSDQAHTERWQGWVRLFVDDPFWQLPHFPCDREDETWAEDLSHGCSGFAAGQFAHAPQIEARCAVRDGAPALPTGITLGCTAGECNVPGMAGNDGDAVCEIATEWGLWLAQCDRVAAGGLFAEDYSTQGVQC